MQVQAPGERHAPLAVATLAAPGLQCENNVKPSRVADQCMRAQLHAARRGTAAA